MQMLKKTTATVYSDFKKRFFAKKNKLINATNTNNVKCIFCDKCPNSKDFLTMINKALYVKFAASQNYYYCKDINEILSKTRNKISINFKDQQSYDEEEEYLKRYYPAREINGKLTILTEYYKFHSDVPRIFIQSIAKLTNYYHDRKRKIEYIRITKIINDKNQEIKNKQAKKDENSKLNEGQQLKEKLDPKLEFLKILDEIDLNEEKKIPEAQKNDISGVSTVIELQKKLGAIINEKFSNDLLSELNINEESIAYHFDGSSFLKFMNDIEQKNIEKKIKVTSNFIKNEDKNLNNEKENTVLMKKFLKQNFNHQTEKHNSTQKQPIIKLPDDSFKKKEFIIKEKELNILNKNSLATQNKFKLDSKITFIRKKNSENIIKNASSNQNWADLNYLAKKNFQKNASNDYSSFKRCQTETIENEYKNEIKPKANHARIFSTLDNNLPKNISNNYMRNNFIKSNSSITKKNINSINSLKSQKNIEEKKISITKPETFNQHHKNAKSDMNGGRIANLNSPKSNKDLKYFYKIKKFSNVKNITPSNFKSTLSKKNSLLVKSQEETLFSINVVSVSPKLNLISIDSNKDKSRKLLKNFELFILKNNLGVNNGEHRKTFSNSNNMMRFNNKK